MLKTNWTVPPATHDQLYYWKVYCRIWNDVGLQAPGAWIHLWMKNDYNEEPLVRGEEDVHYESWLVCREAIRYYVMECRE